MTRRHYRKPGIIRDQKTKPGTTKPNPVRSAKPSCGGSNPSRASTSQRADSGATAAEKASVAENAPLLTVVDLSAFEVEFQLADVYARDIKPGMEAQIALDGQNYPGIVTAISPEVRSGQVTGRVKFAGDQPPGLRQSQRGSVRIVIEQRAKAVKRLEEFREYFD